MRTAAFVLAALLLVAMLLLTGCGESGAGDINAPTVGSSNNVPGRFFEITVAGKPCIAWIHEYDGNGTPESHDSFSGLTCDWSLR